MEILIKGITDSKELKCRPKLTETTKIDANIKCGSVATEVACKGNTDCRWAKATQ